LIEFDLNLVGYPNKPFCLIFYTPLEVGFSASGRKADDELQRVVARIREIIDEPES
jgi:hypothetical protein